MTGEEEEEKRSLHLQSSLDRCKEQKRERERQRLRERERGRGRDAKVGDEAQVLDKLYIHYPVCLRGLLFRFFLEKSLGCLDISQGTSTKTFLQLGDLIVYVVTFVQKNEKV